MAATNATVMDDAPRVAGLPSLAAFALVLASLLALVFPTGREYAELTAVTKPDAYSVAYLDVLTRANPEESELRLVHARQLAMLGRFDDALFTLAPTIDRPEVAGPARSLRLDVSVARARAIPEGDPRRAAAFEDVRRELQDVALWEHTPERLASLATLSLELGEPRVAAAMHLRLAGLGGGEAAGHYALAGRWLRAAGESKRAAKAYESALALARDPTEARGHALEAIRSLEAADAVAPAADLAGRFAERFPEDTAILGEATRLATACGRAVDARAFGRRILALTPDDEAVLRAQAMRELGAADPKAAIVILDKLVTMRPDDYDLRVLRVRTAEWTGDLDSAERDLLWLIAHPKAKTTTSRRP